MNSLRVDQPSPPFYPRSMVLRSLIALWSMLCWFGFGLSQPLHAQWMNEYLGDERVLYAETKQVNQFFRRFNCEEAPDGNRYYSQDSLYHHPELRSEYLDMLFDQQSSSISPRLKRQFKAQVMDQTDPIYLDFHGGDWFAEVTTTFWYQGRERDMILFLQLEEANVGSKWVFTNVYFEPFHAWFNQGETEEGLPPFIHPLSHELDFMNLIKVFRDGKRLEQYANKAYEPDYLTLFLYEMKREKLRFETVRKVKFHFFQVDGWYFELSDIQREGSNRGWLISSLSELKSGNKDLLLKYIYRR
jgi:hypothetical protein